MAIFGLKRPILWRFYAAVNTPYLGLQVTCHDISVPFELNLDLFDIFLVSLEHNISQISVQSERRYTVGRTDMTKQNGTFRYYANALKTPRELLFLILLVPQRILGSPRRRVVLANV
jgi:hypothetical protein